MKRLYTKLIQKHLRSYRQMVFIGGARQVSKTTIAQAQLSSNALYLNWDVDLDREKILLPSSELIDHVARHRTLGSQKSFLVLDELHKYKNWKNYLKGFYDLTQNEIQLIVTGSASLTVHKKDGDSLMGRYFPYTVHPLSVYEIAQSFDSMTGDEIQPHPLPVSEEKFQALWRFGGFPEPFLRQEDNFYQRWSQLKKEQLCRQDISDIHVIKDMKQFELLVHLLTRQSGQLLNLSTLAKHVRVAHNTIRRWIDILNIFYYTFTIPPWSKNVARSLIKEPKIYLWDWSLVQDKSARFENFVASHLWKAVSFWNESGLGAYGLHFLRTKDQKEVDFLVVKNGEPWFLVECKYSAGAAISKTLREFHQSLGTKHAFQVVFDMPYVDANCFQETGPVIVPARTFLSQFV